MSKFNLPQHKNYPAQVADRLRRQLRQSSTIIKVIQVLVGGVLPIVEGIFVNLATGAQGDAVYPYIACLGVIVVVHLILLGLLLSVETTLPQFLVQFDDQAEKMELAQAEVATYELYSTTFLESINAALYSLTRIDELSRNPEGTLNTVFQQVLLPWTDGRKNIFWFQAGDAFYNFAVYMPDASGTLNVVYRLHDDRITPANRSWKPGDGHVGTCFLREDTIFLDIPEGEAIPDNLLTTQPRTEDYAYYRSMMATPIIVDETARGVFVVTSSEPEQFEKDLHISIMDIVGMLLAQSVKYCFKEAGDGEEV